MLQSVKQTDGFEQCIQRAILRPEYPTHHRGRDRNRQLREVVDGAHGGSGFRTEFFCTTSNTSDERIRPIRIGITTMAMIIQIELRNDTQNVVSFTSLLAQLVNPVNFGGLMLDSW